jgi:hypothetical protein
MVIGCLITILVAKYYYQRATKDLNKEASELRRLTDLVIQQIERVEKSDLGKVIRDESGKVIGFKILEINVHDSLHSTDSTSPKISVESNSEHRK